MLVDLSVRLILTERQLPLEVEWSKIARTGLAALLLGTVLFSLAPTLQVVWMVVAALASPLAYTGILLLFRVLQWGDLVSGSRWCRRLLAGGK